MTLPSDTEILITREFDASCEHVFKVWTTPELVRRWWHAKRGEVTVAEIDLRPGGSWRYAMIATGGFEVAFHGEYREVLVNERIVSTEIYEGAPDAEALSTVTFEELDGRTTVSILVAHRNQADRDMHINSGMEDGLQDALDLLELAAIAQATQAT
ncbi:MAG: SRPBCC family protein [Solirubrobacteraceae bacterium]